MTRDTEHQMRGSDRAMIAVGVMLIALVVLGFIVGAIQDAQISSPYSQPSDQSFRPVDVIFLAVGALLVLAGAIRDALHRR